MTIVYYELFGKRFIEVLSYQLDKWNEILLLEATCSECVWIVPGTEIDE